MAIHKTEALVIKTQAFRSSSLIVTFFTPQLGKIRGVAKGIHRAGETRQAGYELFTRAEYVFYEKKRSDLHLISDAFILQAYPEMQDSLKGIAYGSYFCELVDELTELHDPHPAIFELLKEAFHCLSFFPPEKMEAIFVTQLLREMGWLPFLDGCLECGQKDSAQMFFSIRHGVLLCELCRAKDTASQAISDDALNNLRRYSKGGFKDALKTLPSNSIQKEICKLITTFLNYRLGKSLKTRQFIDSIKDVLK